MSKQRIGLVRHGLTDWNMLGKIQGQTDIPLNDTGRQQAQLLADRLLQESYIFDGVISSGLKRAQETATIIANTMHIPLLQPDSGLRERAFGLVEGTTPEEREQRWGSNWRQMELGQESDLELQHRAVEALESIAARYKGQNLLLVSHGSWLAQLFISLFGEKFQGHIANLSYSIVEYQDHMWKPELMNCTKHMQPSDAFTLQRRL